MNFSKLKKVDQQMAELIDKERERQQETLMMIPSENIASQAVQEAVGSCLANKYAEGYPKRRYYQGQEFVDQIEELTIERAKKAFQVPFANVQALSGSPANLAVYFSLLKPGEKLMGLKLASGGHLTHGAKVSASGTYYQSVAYRLGSDGWMDYQAIEKLALKEKPRLIVAGITAYPRVLDWKKFSRIAEKAGALLMADISHLAGLVVGGAYPSPVDDVDLVTTTTHKTLRGPRGAIIMVTNKGLKKDPDLGKRIDKAVFPGLQGGPHLNAIAGIGVALKESQTKQFKTYAQQIIDNCRALAKELINQGFDLVSGGTDSHLILIDLKAKELTGNLVAEALEAAGIVVNKNAVPNDPRPPFYPSGLRMGTPGLTTRGMKPAQMVKIAGWIKKVVEATGKTKKAKEIDFDQEKKKKTRGEIIAKTKTIGQIRQAVHQLCQKFPLPE